MSIDTLLKGNNNPQDGFFYVFDSSDHIRFQNGKDVSGHNYGAHRRIVIEKNIEGGEGYTVTMYNMDGVHPLWQDNVQMSPKRMRIESVYDNIVDMRGYGYDSLGGLFSDYGVVLLIDNNEVSRVQLNMFDRNISIVYLK